ncbi:unnamed protein product, partial [marine sediment metagenome]
MAKKKAEPKKEDIDIDEKDLVDDEEVESHYPDLSDKSKEESVTIDVVDDDDEEEEEEGYEIEPEELPTFKFLTLALKK